jgi:hypothetical protein
MMSKKGTNRFGENITRLINYRTQETTLAIRQ